jgi:hypothetical protein
MNQLEQPDKKETRKGSVWLQIFFLLIAGAAFLLGILAILSNKSFH